MGWSWIMKVRESNKSASGKKKNGSNNKGGGVNYVCRIVKRSWSVNPCHESPEKAPTTNVLHLVFTRKRTWLRWKFQHRPRIHRNHPFQKQMPDTITIRELPWPQLVRLLLSSKKGQLCNNTNLKVKHTKPSSLKPRKKIPTVEIHTLYHEKIYQ